MKDTDYIYLSTYIRAKEAGLLSRERLERMAAAPDADEAAKVLAECGYPELEGASDAELEAVFAERRMAVLDDMARLCPEPALVEAFRLRYDYHNAKVLVKAEGANVPGGDILSDSGRVSAAKLTEAWEQDDWRGVPTALAAAIREARSVLARSSNPQLADMGLDKAYYAELLALTETLSTDFYTRYVRLSIDTTNLRSAVRCMRGHMDEGVLRAALIEGGDVPTARIARQAYGDGPAAVFTDRRLQKAAELGQQAVEGAPLAPFERACDNALTRFLDEAKYVSFGPEPAVAYIAAMEGEIVAARMVLLGKRSGLSQEELRERLRESYV
ncbi:MAG: V-type ATPase subunit [Oscillospiraceae bacterium]